VAVGEDAPPRLQDLRFLQKGGSLRVELITSLADIQNFYTIHENGTSGLCCEVQLVQAVSRSYLVNTAGVAEATVIARENGGFVLCLQRDPAVKLQSVEVGGGTLYLTVAAAALPEPQAKTPEPIPVNNSNVSRSPAATGHGQDETDDLRYFLSYGSEPYRLGTGDIVAISVYQHEDLSMQVTIPSDGFITYPLLGRLQLAGKTIQEAQETIYTQLSANYLVNPQVTLNVVTYDSQWVFIGGAVRSQGKINLRGPMTLSDAVAAAGGINPGQRLPTTLYLSRGEGDKTRVLKVPVKDLIENPSSVYQKVYLKAGDRIDVSLASGNFYVNGEVNHAGVFDFYEGLTLSRAIAHAGGVSQWGSLKNVELVRRDSQKAIKVNVNRILEGKDKDIPLNPDDMIVVKRRRF
jgi:polysaccharide export outer membrane protein